MSHTVEYGLQLNENAEGGLTNADIDRMKAAGARWIRVNCGMDGVWPTALTFTNDTPDYVTGAAYNQCVYAKSIGLQVLATCGFVAGWASQPGGNIPNDFAQFATMCARAYRDLNGVVDAFEIWNEANNSPQFWHDASTNVNRYRDLLRAVVIAMRFQASVMSGKTWASPFIVSSGFASTGSGSGNWTDRWDRNSDPTGRDPGMISIGASLDRLFHATLGLVGGRANGTAYVDAYGVHAYSWGIYSATNTFFENPLVHSFARTIPVGSTQFAYWDDIICVHEGYADPANPPVGHKKIWSTETGWPGTDPGLGSPGSEQTYGTEAQVAVSLDTAWSFWEFFHLRGAGNWFHFMSRDDPNTAFADAVQKYGGLLRLNNTAKPVRAVYQTHALNYSPTSTPVGGAVWDSSTVTWDDPLIAWDGGVIGTPPPPDPGPTDVPNILVELGIHPRASDGPYIVLDSTTRTLDSSYVLAPEFAWQDISGYTGDLNLTQGRNQELARPQPGSITATLDNRDRRFDKRNTAGPYWPYLAAPRPQVRVSVDGVPWITGSVTKLNSDYYDVNRARTTVEAHDALAGLATTQVTWTAGVQQSGLRIHRILDDAGFRGNRSIWSGVFTLGAYPVDARALDELGLIAESEDTLLYADPTNTIVFANRATLGLVAPGFTFADDGSGNVDYKSITYANGDDLFANQIDVTRRAADSNDVPNTKSYSDEYSVTDHGRVVLPITNSPVVDDVSALLVAAQIGSRYATPVDRIDSVTLNLADFPLAKRVQLGLIGQGAIVGVVHHPPGAGSPSAVNQLSLVIGRHLQVSNGVTVSAEATWFFKAIDGGA